MVLLKSCQQMGDVVVLYWTCNWCCSCVCVFRVWQYLWMHLLLFTQKMSFGWMILLWLYSAFGCCWCVCTCRCFWSDCTLSLCCYSFVPVEAAVVGVSMMVLVDPVVIVDVDGIVTGSRSWKWIWTVAQDTLGKHRDSTRMTILQIVGKF